MEAEIHATTGIGPVRKGNEDNYLLLNLFDFSFWTKSPDSDEYVIKSHKFEIEEQGVVLAVSDGCGGALSGEIASEIAVENVKGMLVGEIPTLDQSFYDGTLIERLYDATVYANYQIHTSQRNNAQYSGMGTTFTSAAITLESVDFIQVGDSRAYLIRRDKIFQITKDQSLVNQLIDSGEISPQEAETHPLKNVILQALGAQNEVFPDVVRLIPQRDDILLLCSDGLSNYLKDQDLLGIVLNNLDNLANAARFLIKEANERGGYDNITVILAKLSGSELIEPTEDSVVIYPLKFAENPMEIETS